MEHFPAFQLNWTHPVTWVAHLRPMSAKPLHVTTKPLHLYMTLYRHASDFTVIWQWLVLGDVPLSPGTRRIIGGPSVGSLDEGQASTLRFACNGMESCKCEFHLLKE